MFHSKIEADCSLPASPSSSPTGGGKAASVLLGVLVLAVALSFLAVRLFAWAITHEARMLARLAVVCGECMLEARRGR